MSDVPEGHPIPWDELVAYERDQGGYWLYPKGCDVYGNGKIWVRVPRPEEPRELDGYLAQARHLAQRARTRAAETGNEELGRLADALARGTDPGGMDA